MKKYISIFVALLIAFAIVKFPLSGAESPQALMDRTSYIALSSAHSIMQFVPRKTGQNVAEVKNVEINLPVVPVKGVYAAEKKYVMYKGKKLEVSVFDQRDEVPTSVLNYLYLKEITKEGGQHLQIPNN
jgi:hypothetical protein